MHRRTLLGSPALTLVPSSAAAAAAAPARRVYDPLADPRGRVERPTPGTWEARWIWVPGQRAAHLHAAAMQASVERCVHIGYPGHFRAPAAAAYFRRRGRLEAPQALRWAGPAGRVLVSVNGGGGEITRRAATAPAGEVELVVTVDFCRTLPCLLLVGGALSTDERWEASLDGRTWVPAEAGAAPADPARTPDVPAEAIVTLPPDRIVSSRGVVARGGAFKFQRGGELVVDFFHDELGALAFELEGRGGVTISVGESAREVADPEARHLEQHPLPVARAAPRPAPIVTPERCVRYARLVADDRCTVRGLALRVRSAPVTPRGRFACSDPVLQAIWDAGAATVHACMHGLYLDGLRRDALPWALDALCAIEAGDLLFADRETARETLLTQTLPPAPTAADLGIVDFPLYAVLGFARDHAASGDGSFARRHFGRVADILELFLRLRGPDGFVRGALARPWGFLADWERTPARGPDAFGTPAYAQMLLVAALEAGAGLGDAVGDGARAGAFRRGAAELRRRVREAFWDPREGAFTNGLREDGRPDGRFTSFAQVWAILLDLATPAEWPGLFARVLDAPARRGANVSLGQHFELQAYVKAGRVPAVLDRLRRVWGGLVRGGASRFYEDLRPADDEVAQLAFYGRPYANSLCHVWAGAAPVVALAGGVLGIAAAAPGFARCRVRPALGDLAWAEGAVPTPAGPITIRLEGDAGTLELPAGVSAALEGYAATEGGGGRALEGPGRFAIRRG